MSAINPITTADVAGPTPFTEAKLEYTRQKDRLTKATQEFESVFVGLILKQMRKSPTQDQGLFGASHEAKLYQDMMDDTTASQIGKAGSFGLAKMLCKRLEKTLPPDPEALLRQAVMTWAK